MRDLQKLYDAARRRIEKAEEHDPYDTEYWEQFWDREINIQHRSLERALPNHRMPWNDK